MKTATPYASFPNDPCFSQLVSVAEKNTSITIVDDPGSGVKADYNRLLRDIANVQRTLHNSLSLNPSRGNALKDETVYVCTLLGPNYTFIVSLLAILATGCAAVPLCMAIPSGYKSITVHKLTLTATTLLLEEALSLIARCKPTHIISDSDNTGFAERIQAQVQEQLGLQIHILCPNPAQDTDPVDIHNFTIDPDVTFSPGSVSLVLFTSGTTGPPKAIVHNRRVFYPDPMIFPMRNDRCRDVFLVYRTVVSADGVLPLIRYILTGVQLEIFNRTWDPASMWERLRQGGLTILVGAPVLWLKLMRYYETTLIQLSDEERLPYVQGAQALRVAIYIGGLAMPDVKTFWWDLRRGEALQSAYGSTELGSSCIKSSKHESPETFNLPIIGTPKKGFEVKLSNGVHGEILVKSPFIYAGYLNDATTVTPVVLDDEGYFHTGDLAHMEGENFVIDGRLETDFIKFLFEFRVPRLLVESQISRIPGIIEAFVVPVPDPECGERVGAIVRSRSFDFSIDVLRAALSDEMPVYHLPTVLYLLDEGEDVPRTRTNKLDIKKAVGKFFASEYLAPTDRCLQKLEVYDISQLKGMNLKRPWDWAGIQR